jgi:hypothetical protein
VTERSEGTNEHSTLVTSPTKEGPVTERSEGTDKHSTLVTSPTKEGP